MPSNTRPEQQAPKPELKPDPAPAPYPVPFKGNEKATLARWMRNNPSAPEAVLWRALKPMKRFRSQVVLAGWIVDFLDEERKLVIEVDGAQFHKPSSDRRRDRALQRRGYRTVRLSARLVLNDLDAALKAIFTA